MKALTNHYLFSYGTLQLEQVQIETYGRKLKGFKDSLKNFRIEQLEIFDKSVLDKSGQQFHPIAIPSQNENDSIEGVIYEITEKELLETDKYEVSDYKRTLETFQSGKNAWVYIYHNKFA
jgi:gamma-glutamylcyclotransferase (GGCT)/AIG2-like uncharacterized protein YtfP